MNLLSIKIAVAALILLCVLAGVHNWNKRVYKQGMAEVQTKWDKEKFSQSLALAKTVDDYRAKEQSYQTQLSKAENDKAIAIQTLTVDRDNALRSVSSLSNSLNAARAKLSTSTAPACAAVTQYASAATDVLESCTGKYRELAEKADSHRLDSQALIAAWPR